MPIPKLVDLSPDGDSIVEYPDSPIRSFLDSDIQRQINEAVETLGDKHGAVVPYFKLNANGDYVARLAAVAKLDSGWSVMVAFEKRAGSPVGLEAGVKFTW